MEEKHEHDEHVSSPMLQISQENSQPIESDIKQDTVLSTVSATFPVLANNPTYCSYDYKFVQNITCEHKLPEHLQEGNAGSQTGHTVDDRTVFGLQTVKCEEHRQELNEQRSSLPFIDTDEDSPWTYDLNELTDVKPESKADPDEYGGHFDEPRHWVVCQDGVLKEVKAEHTLGGSDILPVEDGSHNVDQTQHISGTDYAKPECESRLNVRKRTGTVVKPFTCETCGKSFTKSRGLHEHERTHTGERPYTCDTCGRSFAASSNLRLHEKTHTGVKPYTCDTCGKSFLKSGDLRRHERTHTGVRPYSCDTCGKSFVQSHDLRRHERTHAGDKPHTCETCGKSSEQSNVPRLHERTHTYIKPYTCDTCGKSFSQSNVLRRHERTHTGYRPYICDSCGKSYSRSDVLVVHERTHTGVKPYTCGTCGKSFTQSSALTEHERTHVSMIPFTCDTCGKPFVRAGDLRMHKRTHTDEKP